MGSVPTDAENEEGGVAGWGLQIAAFNHTSYVDAPAIMWLLAPSGVSKASNANLPILGTCIKAYQNIYVPRESIDTKKVAATTADPTGPKPAPSAPISKLIADRCARPLVCLFFLPSFFPLVSLGGG